MTALHDSMDIARLNLMKQRARQTPAQRLSVIRSEVRHADDYKNYVACTNEHMWYLARAAEQIAKGMGVHEHVPPTTSGKKGLP